MRKIISKPSTIETLFLSQENSPCNGVENISIIVHKRRSHHNKKRKKNKQDAKADIEVPRNKFLRNNKCSNINVVSKRSSTPEFTNKLLKIKVKRSGSDATVKKSQVKHPYHSKFFVNAVSESRHPESFNPFTNPLAQIKWRVYRCQLSTQDESCCCSCNSDAMFEVMKSLYDCYKKKNCDHCNCILCGHMPREERKLGELRKSGTALSTVGVETDKQKAEKQKKLEKTKKSERAMVGKSPAEKEKILKDLAMAGAPLPEGKTASEKELIKKVKTEVGLPQEAKTAVEKEKMKKAEAAGIITPLEGKTTAQKEKILEQQAKAGIPLPEGRTESEKALVQKVKTAMAVPSKAKVPSEKLKKAKAAGFLTPLEGKSPEQKEKILKGLAMSGVPLPEGKTTSDKKLIDKVRTEVGLPPEPKSSADKKKYQQALASGIVTPLEGKSKAQKEKILRSQAEAGLPLPEGRTVSEKALVAKIKATAKPPSEGTPSKKIAVSQSEKLRKAKAAGLITPLEGKSADQKEKILKGLAMNGVPLPDGKTVSEKKLIEKVRNDVGLPPEPKTASDKEKYSKALAAGLLTPLEGKSPSQQEKILKGQLDMGLPLPEGRTASEKALIQKVKTAGGERKKSKTRGVTAGSPALPPEKAKKLDQKTAKVMKEGKGPSDECICDLLTPESERVSMRKSVEKAGVGKVAEKVSVGKAATAKSPSERLKVAKAAGLLTPLSGKSPEQKEKILKGLVKQGIPLPEGKTASEKKLIEKVRTDQGLPPEPKTASMKEKYTKSQAQGLITPLEGKSPAQKEKILKAQIDAGLSLPEGRTASEKALISKVKATAGAPTVSKIPSEKLRKAKAAGLLTPLSNKTPEQKEKILRGLANQGIPLPEAKTASEKKIIEKVRADLGLPPEPKTPSMKEKYVKAQAQGIMTPLEGKSAAQKENILKAQAEAGISLPEGRTPSEKALINKIKAAVGSPSVEAKKIPSEKLRKAKAAGLLSPLEGKSPSQKEKILKGQLEMGLPLPEGRTASEKALVQKVKTTVGVKKKSKTKAVAAGSPALPPDKAKKLDQKTAKVMKEGKGPSDECICGLLTPESERVSVGKVASAKSPSERLKAAKAAGLLTPLSGKSPEQKEKILKAQADAGIPLPEGRTASEKAIISKIKASTKAPSEKMRKAKAAGLVEGKTPSKIPSEKLKEAKAAGLLTPLEGKSKDQKEKILKGLVKAHLPLPEGKSPSDQELIRKVRDDMGLPQEPKTPSIKEKYKKALAAGVITPLEGKTAAQKEKVLKNMHEAGVPLPEGRTPSEKSLVRKIKATPGAPPSKIKVPSEKMKAAKAAGLLTPLEGKTPAQKEKILRGLAKSGMPLPEGKTPSDKEMIRKVTKDVGLPPEPKSPSVKERIQKAQAAGLVTPLEGKTPAQKEKILKSLAQAGVPLPEGRTASEKALVSKTQADLAKKPSKKGAAPPAPLSKEAKLLDQKTAKVMKEGKGPSDECICPILTPESEKGSVKSMAKVASKIPSEKLKKAKAAGLLTPLEGKSLAQKEKILKGLAETGIPLPEGKSPSEKALVQKVKTEYGIPKAVTPSEKEIVRKAKTEGLFTPLAGKTAAQKEKTLKGLAEAGLPMPEGKTASEKQLIKKVRTAAGLPPEATASEKLGKVKTKSKKIGAAASKRLAKGVGGSGLGKAGILEEFEDVLKTTTCDRGCGCDKKKIRFKHSYVKIRVTSPDISSLCPCPEECVPGVKGGVFVDNEGIKVTVGSALGFPSFSIENESKISYKNNSLISTNSSDMNLTSMKKPNQVTEAYNSDSFKIEYVNPNMKASYSNQSLSKCTDLNDIIYEHDKLNCYINNQETKSDLCRTSTSRYLIACSESCTSTSEFSSSFQDTLCNATSKSSFDSIDIIKTESSLSFPTKSTASIRTISIISFHNGSVTSRSSHYLCYQYSRSTSSINAEDSEYFTNVIDYSALDSLASQSEEVINYPPSVGKKQSVLKSIKKDIVINDPCIFRMSHINMCDNNSTIPITRKHPRKSHNSKHNHIIVINELNNDEDIITMVDEILAKKDIANASSIFVVVPTSDEYDTDITDSASSTICIRISENFFDWKNSLVSETTIPKRTSSKKAPLAQGLKISARGKKYFTDCSPKCSKIQDEYGQNKITETIFERTMVEKDCQVDNIVELTKNRCRGVSMDTTQDRPCCCSPREPDTPDNYGSNDRFVANAFSELITPMLINQGVAQGLSQNTYLNDPRLDKNDYRSFLSPNQTLSVAPCDIPPCSTSSLDCHEFIKPSPLARNTMGTQHAENQNLNGLQSLSPCKDCKCNLGKDQEAVSPSNVQSIGRGYGPTQRKMQTSSSPINYPNQGIGEHPCSNCGRPTMKDGKKISCLCSGMEKKIQLPSLCPCEAHRPPLVSTGIGPNRLQTRSKGDQYIQSDTSTTNQSSPCVCKDGNSKKGKNNIICECPEVEEEPYVEEEFNYLPEIDERENRKMKSDQTQTTSGFKFNVKKRPSLEEEMSFEDALKYFEENPTVGDGSQVDDSCFCDENGMPIMNTTGVNCECPYDDLGDESSVPPEEPFTGLKIHIGGKGSGSKGLSGICCFDVVQESNGLLLLHD